MTLSRTSFLAILLLLLCQHPTTVCRAGPQQMKKLTHFSFPNSMVQSMKRITAYSLLSTFLLPLAPAQAIEWTSFNRAAAEVWRTVDDLYLDRSFNGKDWFALRQQLVKRNYESETDFSSAMKDALMQLGDKYTRYLTPAQYDALLSSAQGSLVGIGAELAEDSEQHTVQLVRISPSSPAELAGLQAGDSIVNVDGVDCIGKSAEEVALLLRGKPDTKASIRLKRKGEILDFKFNRQEIKVQGVRSQLITLGESNKKAGYIGIRSFSASTATELLRSLESFHQQERKGLKFILFDLRDNGGGLLQGAVDGCSLLLKSGEVVVFEIDKDGISTAKMTSGDNLVTADPQLPDLSTPCYILTNSNTASAAEVFAAALQDQHRASIVGEKSFGKAVIQTLKQVQPPAGGVAVTIAKYETPQHRDINKKGVDPDLPLFCGDPIDCVQKLAGEIEGAKTGIM